MINKAVLGVLLIGALLLAGCINLGPPSEKPTITTSGDAEKQVAPDQAEIFVGVETNATSPEEAQRNNSAITTAVTDALKRAGVASEDIETLDYNLYPNRVFIPEMQKEEIRGYIVTQTVKVTTKDLQKVGTLLSVAVEAGANRIQNVQFSISKARENAVKTEVLSDATMAARVKAQAIANGTGAKLGALKSVTESSFNIIPYRLGAVAEAGAIKAGAPVPPITPSKVTVTASVTLVYEIKQ